MFAWGLNASGQCGQPSSSSSVSRPTLIEGLQEAIRVAGGSHHSLALTKNGKIFSWGGNQCGELGRRASGASHEIGPVDGGKTVFASISSKAQVCAAIDAAGSLWVWGFLQGEGATAHAKAPRQCKLGSSKRDQIVVKVWFLSSLLSCQSVFFRWNVGKRMFCCFARGKTSEDSPWASWRIFQRRWRYNFLVILKN